ncbi:NAD(P)/FAD-dependent oxidoreductase, partial [bacterium]|nr:NAD(P)/FAD-dependent oxidoreductase [bacterium]
QTVNEKVLKKERPDTVILATGARPLTIPIKGVDKPNVVQAWDVLLNKTMTGKRVVIVGGGAVGVETALFLAEKGTLSGDALKFLFLNQVESDADLRKIAVKGSKEVTVIEMLEKIGKDIGRSTRWVMMSDLERYGVTTRTTTKALEITDKGVKVECDGKTEEILADTVILASGSVPENSLKATLEKLGIPFQIAGDAGRIGLAYNAVHEGFEVGRSI